MVQLSTKVSLLFPLLAAAAAAAAVSAANDWTVKCKGICSYDTNGTKGRAFATLSIAGPSSVVSDITPAASWELLDCPEDWSSGSRDVRLVCTVDDSALGGCDDLIEDGAENTLVRLPENCGTGPFARVVAWGVAQDQSIPQGSAAEQKLKLRKRAEPAQVMQATLDWQLKTIPPERGTVDFDLQVASNPVHYAHVVDRRSVDHPPLAKRSDFFGELGKVVVGGAKAIGGLFLGDVFDKVDNALGGVIGKVVDKVGDLTEVDLRNSGALNTISFKENVPIFNTTIECNAGPVGFTGTVGVNVDVDAQANVGFAIAIRGTIIPPGIRDFVSAAVMSGRVVGSFNIDALLEGEIDTGEINLAEIGIPGLFFPGVFSLGPIAAVAARGVASVSMDMSLQVPFIWDFPTLSMVFPPNKGPSNGDASEDKNTASMQMNFRPGTLDGSIEIHLIPKVSFGFDLLNGFASAEIFLAVDTDGRLDLDATIQPDFAMDGCATLSVGVDVNVGASGSLTPFFDATTSFSFFKKRAEILKKCFGEGDGPAAAILDNGDGTFTNALGDLVNESGQLIDENGEVIPDADAVASADPAAEPAPVLDEAGTPIPEEDLVFQEEDGTFETADGRPTNEDGQLIDSNGLPLGCELDLSTAVDEDGVPIPPEEVLVRNSDGTFSDGNCNIVDANGQPIDVNGNVIDYEPFVDETTGEIIPNEDVIIDNGDGTFSDTNGNSVDEFGGAIDFAQDGSIIPVDIQPQPDFSQQEPADTEVTTDPPIAIKSPDEVKSLAQFLVDSAIPPKKREYYVPRTHITAPRVLVPRQSLGCFPTGLGGFPSIPGLPIGPPVGITALNQLTRFF